jgi:hypothetical protein
MGNKNGVRLMGIVKTYIAAFIVLIFLNLSSLPTFACSLQESYLRPSNYDLVKEADSIVLAEAVSFNSKTGFIFNILEVIKGDFTENFLIVDGGPDYLGRTDENDFSNVRRGAGTGACNAYDYRVAKKFLLFVNKTKSGWVVSGPPFSRINEEVDDVDSPWVVAVRHYVRISSLNNYEVEKNELNILKEYAEKGEDTKKYPEGLIKDVEAYFNSPYPTKSYQDLITLYNNPSKEERRKVLWALIESNHSETKVIIQNLLQSGEWEEYIFPVCKYLEQTKDRGYINTLGSAYLKLKGRSKRWDIMWALIDLADEKDTDLMLAALKSANEEEASRIAVWFVRHPAMEATDIIKKLVDKKYHSRWELAFSLAGLGDEKVLWWGKKMINSSDKDRWMGYYIVAHSPLAEADKLAVNTIKKNKPKDLIPLIQGYKDSFNPYRYKRLHDIIDLKSEDTQVDYWLKIVLEEMEREGDNKAAELRRSMDKQE